MRGVVLMSSSVLVVTGSSVLIDFLRAGSQPRTVTDGICPTEVTVERTASTLLPASITFGLCSAVRPVPGAVDARSLVRK